MIGCIIYIIAVARSIWISWEWLVDDSKIAWDFNKVDEDSRRVNGKRVQNIKFWRPKSNLSDQKMARNVV